MQSIADYHSESTCGYLCW